MDYQQLWQSTLEQLKSEMPRASFETWLQDARPLSFDNGVLTVLARNAYACDWLEDRLGQTLSQTLSGLAQTAVKVRFAVAQDESEDEAESDDDAPDGQPLAFTAEPVDATRYQNEVRPERVVMLDGYALRLMEHGDVTPKEMSLWVGFRQAIYQHWKKGSGALKNIPYWEVLRFANMSRSTYFRETTGKDWLIGGLVEVVPEPGIPTDDRRFENAKRYRVHMTPRLTRKDCAALESILLAEASMAVSHTEALEIVLGTLKRLAESDPGEYLNQPNVQVGKVWHKSVQDIARRVLDIKGDLPAKLREASEKVFDRILRGFGKVVVTHYFLQVAARKFNLTHPQVWAIIALRDRCWYDYETKEQKEYAIVSGGLNKVCSWVGVDRKTAKRWLDAPAFSTFVRMQDMKQAGVPETWDRRDVIFWVRQDEPLEEEIPDKMNNDGGQSGIQPAPLPDKMNNVSGQSETRERTKRTTPTDKMSNGIGQNEQLLNNLFKPLPNLNKPQGTPPARGVSAAALGGTGNRAFWDFDFLMENNQVQTGTKKHLLTTNKAKWGRDISALSAGFVSWLLYAYSPEGVGVKNPTSLAIKRLNENAHAGAHGGFDKLASLTPYALRALFDADLVGAELGDNLEAHIYQATFSELQKPHKLELYGRLFGFEK